MLIYSIGLIITALLMLLAQISYNKSTLVTTTNEKKKFNYKISYVFLIVIAILPMSLISGLRYGLGTDYFYTYFPGFYATLIGNYPYSEHIFNYLIKTITLFTNNPQWLFIITSFIFNIFIILSIKNISKKWFISSIIYIFGNIFFISLNNVRQSCALAISIYAISLLFKYKHPLKYLFYGLLALLALGFHHTSIIITLSVLILQISFIKKHYFIIGIVLLVLTPGLYYLAKYIFSFTQYGWYFEPKNDKPLYHYMFPHLISFILMIICKNNYKDDKLFSNLFLLNIITISITIVSLFMKNNETLSRACNYFDWCIIFIVPYFIKLTNNKIIDILITCLVLLIIFICSYYLFVVLGHHEVFPYRTIINPEWRWY